jgi:protein translocase SecG subunit
MQILSVIQIIVAILLIVAVLLQNSSGGLGAGIAGGQAYHTKRGMEKALFAVTAVLAVLFVIISLASLMPQLF